MTRSHLAKKPLWKWILYFIGIFFLAIIGQVLSLSSYEMANMLGYPGLTIIGVAILLVLYTLFVKLIEKHWARDLKPKHLIPDILLGLLVGFVYMVIVVSTIKALGCADVTWNVFSHQEQWQALMLFLAVAVGEELMCRGVLFRLIDERWNTWVALLVSAAIFGLGHISNDNSSWWASLAIAIEAGLLLGAAYKWSGTLWLPIGIHWAWNYVQGNVFGLAVSGQDAGGHILTTTVHGPDIITGGAFGPEASIIAVIFGIIVTVIFLANRAPKGNKRTTR